MLLRRLLGTLVRYGQYAGTLQDALVGDTVFSLLWNSLLAIRLDWLVVFERAV